MSTETGISPNRSAGGDDQRHHRLGQRDPACWAVGGRASAAGSDRGTIIGGGFNYLVECRLRPTCVVFIMATWAAIRLYGSAQAGRDLT